MDSESSWQEGQRRTQVELIASVRVTPGIPAIAPNTPFFTEKQVVEDLAPELLWYCDS